MVNEIITEISTNKYDLAHQGCDYNILTYILDDITYDRIGLFCDECGKMWRIVSVECTDDNNLQTIKENLKKAFPEKSSEQIDKISLTLVDNY